MNSPAEDIEEAVNHSELAPVQSKTTDQHRAERFHHLARRRAPVTIPSDETRN